MLEIRGLDEAIRKLKRLENNARDLGKRGAQSSELFSPAFMQRHTKVASFDALIGAGGFKVESQDDFEAIPDAEWDNVIRSHTSFSSWREMVEKATEELLTEGA